MNVKRKVLVLMAVLAGLGAFSARPAAAQRADLRVVTSVSPPSPVVQERLTYTHQVSFASGTAATKVTLTDMLPTGATFDPGASDSRCSVDTCGTTVVCSLDTLRGSTSVTVAVIPTSVGLLRNVVGVAAEEYDPVMANNSAVTTTTVVAAPTYCVSGTIRRNGVGLSGVVVSIGSRAATTNSSGTFQICGLANGTYTLVPTLVGYSFSPTSRTFTVAGANVTGQDFTATEIPYDLSGRVTLGGAGLAGVTVRAGSRSGTTDGSGNYVITGLVNGTYPVIPSLSGYTFSPTSRNATINGANVTGVNFAASVVTYSASGTVRQGGSGLANVTVTIGSRSAVTGSAGTYVVQGLPNGSYTAVPTRAGYTFTPASRPVTINGAPVSGIDFSAVPFTVSGASPSVGPTAGGTAVTITGSGFVSGALVTFGGVESPSVTYVDSTSLLATTPARGLAGVVDIVVTNPGGGTATGASLFTYEAPAPTNRFYPIVPCRAVDTRNANGPYGGPAFSGGISRNYDLRGLCGIPANAQGLEVNFTVVGPHTEGALQVAPAGYPPTLDLIPFATGMTRAQFLSVPLTGTTPGLFTVRAMPANATVHVVIDVFGYHAP